MTRNTAITATIEHRIGPSGRLDVKLADWDVELVATSDEIVRVRDADGKDLPDDLEVDRRSDSLSIRQPSLFPQIGFVLGTTANAVANMRALVARFGAAPRAFLIVPLVGAFFIDFTNAIIITFFVNWLK